MAVLRVQRLAIGHMHGAIRAPGVLRSFMAGRAVVFGAVYTCPPGFRVIIRHIDFYTFGEPVAPVTGGTTVAAWLDGPNFTEDTTFFGGETTQLLNYTKYSGQCVMEAGDELWVGSVMEDLSFQATGAKLPL